MATKAQQYFYLDIYSGTDIGATALMDFIQLMIANFVASTYKSKPFTLDFTPTGAAAFVSEKKEGASSVAPKLNCGGTLVAGVATESRPDPNFPGFTEIKYEFDVTGKVAPTEFQMILTPDGNNLPYVKRYGVYFY
ncbi:MAG TPA: hypothetical protein VNM45_02110 [Bacillus sp. (in: firmicutes)]|nr:hypothetical protein [Bacillus sp. (in: firmicutes)]